MCYCAIVKVIQTTSSHSIDLILHEIKKDLSANFTKKWSVHDHEEKDNCDAAIVIDGLWKVHRQKCAFERTFVKTTEFSDIQTGCVESPALRSYYCQKHSHHQMSVKCNGTIVKIKPQDIKVFRLRK